MYRRLDMLCAEALAVGTVGKPLAQLRLFSTCFDVNASLNATSFALVLARCTSFTKYLSGEPSLGQRGRWVSIPYLGSIGKSSPPSAFQRGSMASWAWSAGRVAHFSPHSGQRHKQSRTQSGLTGNAKTMASRIGVSRLRMSPSIMNSSSRSKSSSSSRFFLRPPRSLVGSYR